MFDEKDLLESLEEIIDFSNVEELWVVGSLVEDSSSVKSDSDIDLICKSELVKGERDEFSDYTCDAASILTNPKESWGEVTEGILLEEKVKVSVDGKDYNLQVHLIPQPIDYDVDMISGDQLKIY